MNLRIDNAARVDTEFLEPPRIKLSGAQFVNKQNYFSLDEKQYKNG